MPYFSWKGIDLSGEVRSGYLRALSLEDLEKELLHRDIGLLSARNKKTFLKTVFEADKISFFQRLGSLLNSGVHLLDALKIVERKTKSHMLADIVEVLIKNVEQGIPLYRALEKFPAVFEPLMTNIWRVGQDGDIKGCIGLLCIYLEERQQTKSRLRRAALMPLITGIFFLAIFCGVLLFIIPRFADMFVSLKIDLPSFTHYLLVLSNVMQTTSFFYGIFAILLLIALLRFVVKLPTGKNLWDAFLVKVPYIREFIRERDLQMSLKALSLLLKAGVPLVDSLALCASVIQNSQFQIQFRLVHSMVQEGMNLSYALEETGIADDEILALILVGERTGRLGDLIQESGKLSHERMIRRISFFTTIIQPLLLMLLALSIVGLMFAVYVPILTLSQSIG